MIPSTDNKPASILLLACYEMGHQPLSLAWPLALFKEAGIPAHGVDLSIEAFPTEAAAQASFIGIAVPMHTALRIGVQAARRVQEVNPSAHLCFYGLYAGLNVDYLLNSYADSVISGEYERPLLELVKILEVGKEPSGVLGVSTRNHKATAHLARLALPKPARDHLPPILEYAHYTQGSQHTLAGYVEASRGCLHTCKHCPVVPIYQGRFFIIPFETVLADIRQQVAAGAQHITFGDPDFLNGPGHALKIARALHTEFPQISFNFTSKVEHILEHADRFPEFHQLGCTFVVSAFEAASDHILERLDKGHTLQDMDTALHILERAGIALQPTWMPFTPWTSIEDYLHLLSWIRIHDLVANVPAVQLSIRMLVPPNSALLEHPDTNIWLGALDPANFTYSWTHPDERMDRLQAEIALVAEHRAHDDPMVVFNEIEELAYQIAGLQQPVWEHPGFLRDAPRLSEHWFC